VSIPDEIIFRESRGVSADVFTGGHAVSGPQLTGRRRVILAAGSGVGQARFRLRSDGARVFATAGCAGDPARAGAGRLEVIALQQDIA